jgi:branched-chain amino acid transport system substrate-binding protein
LPRYALANELIREGMMLKSALGCAFATALAIQPACAQQSVKIGFVSTFSGPQGQLGEEIHAGFDLALRERDGKLGGVPVNVIVGDDQTKPDVARQLVDKMIEQDRVDILTGMLNSSVLLAIVHPAYDANKVVISSIAGPSILAGAQCNANFFVAAPQNDSSSEAMGDYLQGVGVKKAFLISSNYPAGRDKMMGFKRYFKGEIVGELYPAFTQLDYAAEIAQIRAANPEAVYEFLPGGVGINFLKQYSESGLKNTIRLYTDFGGLDETMISAVGDAALGVSTASFWTATMKNSVSESFVAAFEKQYKRIPSFYAAAGYDTALLLDTALKKVDGNVSDHKALIAAIAGAKFNAVRGAFRFNVNHVPLSDFYLSTVSKDNQGQFVLALGKQIFANHEDPYVAQCKMAVQ